MNYETLSANYNKGLTLAPIVVIDSGLGGLAFASNLAKALPSENIVVYTDHANLPYGDKSQREIEKRAVTIIENVRKLNPKAVVLACNTLDSLAGERINVLLSGIKLFRVVDITAKAALEVSKSMQIGLMATPATIQSQSYMYSIVGFHPKTQVYGIECPNLAEAIETNTNLKEEIETSVAIFKEVEVDTLILGCTHYNKILPIIKKLFSDLNVIDSSNVLLNYLIDDLTNTNNLAKANLGNVVVITSKLDEAYEQLINKNLGKTNFTIYDETTFE